MTLLKIIQLLLIERSERRRLVEKYSLSDRQANAILDLRLYQLTGMEEVAKRIDAEYAELMNIIASLKIIENEHKLLALIKEELLP